MSTGRRQRRRTGPPFFPSGERRTRRRLTFFAMLQKCLRALGPARLRWAGVSGFLLGRDARASPPSGPSLSGRTVDFAGPGPVRGPPHLRASKSRPRSVNPKWARTGTRRCAPSDPDLWPPSFARPTDLPRASTLRNIESPKTLRGDSVTQCDSVKRVARGKARRPRPRRGRPTLGNAREVGRVEVEVTPREDPGGERFGP